MSDNFQPLSTENLPNTTFEKPQPKPYQQIQIEGKKSFQCLALGCQKIFKFKCDMERHILTHTKEKPITCPYPDCNKGFKRPEALRYHVDTMHINHQILRCPLPDCEHQTHKKELLEDHMGKHAYLRFCAENTRDDEKIYLPWKKNLGSGWEKKYWIKYKTNFEHKKKKNQDSRVLLQSESSLEGLKNDWDILSCFEGEKDFESSEKFFEQLEYLKNKDRDSLDVLFFDNSYSISVDSKKMTQEGEENKEKQSDLPKEKNQVKERAFPCPYPSCNYIFKNFGEFKPHLFPIHQNFECPLADCGWQTHQKEFLEFYHIEKHEYIRKCAENSPDDGKIYLPWKNIVDWERRYWAKSKAESIEERKNSQDSLLSENGLEDLKTDWDILSCLEEDGKSTLSEKFFEQIESWKNKSHSRDLSDTLSLASFRDESPCLITGARDLLRSICKQMAQEKEENHRAVLAKENPKPENYLKSPVSEAFEFDLGL